jgi:hypothetical protein
MTGLVVEVTAKRLLRYSCIFLTKVLSLFSESMRKPWSISLQEMAIF